MIKAQVPAGEQQRMEALKALNILDTPPEERFDRITRIGQRIFGVPIALITLVDSHRQWFKSRQGLDVTETPREVAFCAHTIAGDKTMIVPDARSDPRFRDNPLVTGSLNIRFYAGCTLSSVTGDKLGTFCIIDTKPRGMSGEDRRLLEDFAALAEKELNSVEYVRLLRLKNESEERFRQIAEHIHEVFWMTSVDKSQMLYISPGYERIWGRDRRSLYDSPVSWMDAIHPDDRDRVRRAATANQVGGTYREVYRIIRPDGSIRWIQDTAYPVRDDAGAVEHIVGIAADITGQKNMEEESKIVSAENPNPIIRGGRDGTILYANPAASPMLNEWKTRLGGSAPDEVRSICDEALKTGERGSSEVRTGVKFYSVSAAPVPAGGYVNLYFQDITERKQIAAQFLQAQKMEAIGRLAGGVAHDFNNMLMAIMSFSDLAIMTLPDGHSAAEHLTEVQAAAERAAGLTQQLLAFSRKRPAEPRVVDLNDAIRDQEKMLRRLVGDNVNLKLKLSGSPARVKIDPGQFQQVMMNLVVNAKDAMPDGGDITVRTDASPGRSKGDAGGEVRITVADTGVGMPEDVQPHIFDPFFTTKAYGKGTGLGLSTSYGIVGQYGGAIDVESSPGNGSTFRISLPGAREPDAAPADLDGGDVPRGSETILLVEDQPAVRRSVSMLLTSLGYHVIEAEHGKRALSLFQDALDGAGDRGSQIDLVLTDVSMPEMGGKELADRLRGLRPDVNILFMTGYAGHDVANPEIPADDIAWIQKPVTRGKLARAVRAALDSRVR